jgi:hypothetical protein
MKKKTTLASISAQIAEHDDWEKAIKPVNGQLEAIQTKLDAIAHALFGSPETPDRPGYVERLRGVETFLAGQKKFLWLILSVSVTSLVAVVWKLLLP